MTILGKRRDFDLRDWYWIVADTNKVFSSAKAAYVPAKDPDYVHWTGRGNSATRIATEQELVDAFANGMPDIVPRIPLALLAYSARARAAKESSGWTFEGKLIAPSWAGQLLIVLAHAEQLDKVPWVFADGSAADVSVKSLFDALLERLFGLAVVQEKLAAGIAAETITEPQQIDDAYAAVK